MVYDGSGDAAIKTDIGINADTIAIIGDLSEAVGTFVSSKGWDKEPAPTGRGGGSGSGTPPVSVSSLADYESMLKEKGINVGSEEANSLLKEMAKEKPTRVNQKRSSDFS